MEVTLREHRGRNIATGQEIYLGQYRIMLDGRCIGYVKDAPGSRMHLIERFGSLESEQIEKQVGEMLPASEGLSMVPDVPAEALEPSEEYIDDDFDA